MKVSKSSGKLIGAGILTAIASSLCCITPVLALLAGTGGVASSFSWLESARPYFIGSTILVLGYAWYQKIKNGKTEMTCDCEEEKPSFWQSKLFLAIVTGFALVMMAFPYYSKMFYSNPEKQIIITEKVNEEEVILKIESMGCEACETEINNVLIKQPGVIDASTSYEYGEAKVKFDKTKNTIQNLAAAVEKETGYKTSPKK